MRRVGTVLALALLGGCYSSPPKFFDEACRTETGQRRYETPEPAGLAVPYGVQAFDVLVITGAEWVEYNEGAVYGPAADVFREGVGRYRIRLAKLAEPACQEALRQEGYDPATRAWVAARSPDARYRGAMHACVEAERIGDRIEELYPSGGQFPTLQDRLKGWTAPYVFIFDSEIDPRSLPDASVTRRVQLIVHRETGRPIVEAIGFSFMPRNDWFLRVTECGSPGFSSRLQIPANVFVQPAP